MVVNVDSMNYIFSLKWMWGEKKTLIMVYFILFLKILNRIQIPPKIVFKNIICTIPSPQSQPHIPTAQTTYPALNECKVYFGYNLSKLK